MRYQEAHASLPRPAGQDRTDEILSTLFGTRQASSVERLSDAEIAQLVSAALNDAMNVLGRMNPESALRDRARDAHLRLRQIFVSLPWVQRTDPTVVIEYRKALEFQNLTLDLGLKLVEVVGRYAEVSNRQKALGSAWSDIEEKGTGSGSALGRQGDQPGEGGRRV